jgi:2-polyprenyl-6-methoxyphenol hydroxylase-like FAD-dependent oxidoreductase
LTLGQDLLARVVLQHLNRYPNVNIHWGTKFTGLRQTPDQVVVAAEKAGAAVEFTAHWVVAADGGRSTVRKAVGLTMDGLTWPQRFVVTNIYYDFEKYGWNSGYLVDPVYGAVVYKINLEGLWRFTFAEEATQPLETVRRRSRWKPSRTGFCNSSGPFCQGTRTMSSRFIPPIICISAPPPPIASAAFSSPAMRRTSPTRRAVLA